MNVAPTIARAAEQELALLTGGTSGVIAAVVSTTDGFDVAAKVENTAQVSRLSAMASSMAAIGQVVGQETGVGKEKSVIVEAEGGYVIMVGIRNLGFPMILSVVAQQGAVFGQVLYSTKQAALRLAEIH
jgi:uncharacterized protein